MRKAAARTVAVSLFSKVTTYGSSLSSFVSSVRYGLRASMRSKARMIEAGRIQFRMFAHTKERIRRAGPSK